MFHHMVKMGTVWWTIMHGGKNDVLRCKSLGSGLARSCLFFPRQGGSRRVGVHCICTCHSAQEEPLANRFLVLGTYWCFICALYLLCSFILVGTCHLLLLGTCWYLELVGTLHLLEFCTCWYLVLVSTLYWVQEAWSLVTLD